MFLDSKRETNNFLPKDKNYSPNLMCSWIFLKYNRLATNIINRSSKYFVES
jgi:hypothetical protein